MDMIKRVGSFIYMYQEDDTVLVAYKAPVFQKEAQSLIKERMEGLAEIVEEDIELIYNIDSVYTGIIFKAISEEKLRRALNG